jgi:hypothetical protein
LWLLRLQHPPRAPQQPKLELVHAPGLHGAGGTGLICAELGMHLTQVAPTGCYLVRSNLEGLAMWA